MRIDTFEQARLAIVPFVYKMRIENTCPFGFETETDFYLPPWIEGWGHDAEGTPGFRVHKDTGLVEKVTIRQYDEWATNVVLDPNTIEVGDISQDVDREIRLQTIAEHRQLADA